MVMSDKMIGLVSDFTNKLKIAALFLSKQSRIKEWKLCKNQVISLLGDGSILTLSSDQKLTLTKYTGSTKFEKNRVAFHISSNGLKAWLFHIPLFFEFSIISIIHYRRQKIED